MFRNKGFLCGFKVVPGIVLGTLLGIVSCAEVPITHRHSLHWERMAKQEGHQQPPEFLSTHPATQRRMEDIIRKLPEALQYYNASRS